MVNKQFLKMKLLCHGLFTMRPSNLRRLLEKKCLYATLKPALCHFKESLDTEKIFCFDSSTIILFVDIFKGAGRNALNGKKKGGLKIHTKMPMTDFVPDLVYITNATCNDKTFLGQLEVEIRSHLYLR